MSFVEDTVTENKNYNKKQQKNKFLGFKIVFLYQSLYKDDSQLCYERCNRIDI